MNVGECAFHEDPGDGVLLYIFSIGGVLLYIFSIEHNLSCYTYFQLICLSHHTASTRFKSSIPVGIGVDDLEYVPVKDYLNELVVKLIEVVFLLT